VIGKDIPHFLFLFVFLKVQSCLIKNKQFEVF